MFLPRPLFRMFALLAVVWLAVLVGLSWNIRPFADDIWFFNMHTDCGWLGTVLGFEFNTRWSSYLLYTTVVAFCSDFSQLHHFFRAYFLFTCLFFAFVSWRFLHAVFLGFLKIRLHAAEALVMGILFMLILYFATPMAIEVWFWAIASTTYLYPIIFLLWGSSAIINPQPKQSSWLVIALSFLYIGGGAENYVLGVLSLLASLLLIQKLKPHYLPLRADPSKLMLAIACSLILFLVNILDRGAANRYTMQQLVYHPEPALGLYRFMATMFQKKHLILLVLLALPATVGIWLKQNGLVISSRNWKRKLLTQLLLLLLVTLSSLLPLVLVFKTLGPERTWAFWGFIMACMLIYWAFLAGNNLPDSMARPTMMAIPLLALLITANYFGRHLTPARTYARAYDQRMELLSQQRQASNSQDLYLQALPVPGLLPAEELQPSMGDSWDQTLNYRLKKALQLDFEVFVGQ